jgi:uncharacterized protein YdhG (YjbR/CyaY superfamily)
MNIVDEYISAFPVDVQKKLEQMRAAIIKAAPDAEETIGYGMPTYKLNGNLVHFAGWKNHIGFYATPNGNEAFKEDLSVYKQSKGAVQFPLDKPLPVALIARIVKFRVKNNLEKKAKKAASK